MREVKICVMGSGGVGKSAFVVQMVQGIFVEKYDLTIEDSYRKQTTIDGENVILEILDTAGTEQFTAMRDLYVKNGQAFIIMYSLIAASTFNDLRDLIDQIRRVRDSTDVPIVVVGNKVDLAAQRVVDTAKGEELARDLQLAGFFESSAKNNVNVFEVFQLAVRKHLEYTSARVPKPKWWQCACCAPPKDTRDDAKLSDVEHEDELVARIGCHVTVTEVDQLAATWQCTAVVSLIFADPKLVAQAEAGTLVPFRQRVQDALDALQKDNDEEPIALAGGGPEELGTQAEMLSPRSKKKRKGGDKYLYTPSWTPLPIEFPDALSSHLLHGGTYAYDAMGNTVYNATYSVSLKASMDLRRFPFDRQGLVLRIRPQNYNQRMFDASFGVNKHVAFRSYEGHTGGELQPSVAQVWRAGEPLARVGERGIAMGFHKVPTFELVMTMERKPGFYLTNVMLTLFFIVCTSFSTLLFSPTNPRDRLHISVLLVLTTVAYKFHISSYLPQISYVTFMDKYILLAFMSLFVVVLENSLIGLLVPSYTLETTQMVDWLIIGGVALFWLVLHTLLLAASITTCLRRRWRAVAQRALDEHDSTPVYLKQDGLIDV